MKVRHLLSLEDKVLDSSHRDRGCKVLGSYHSLHIHMGQGGFWDNQMGTFCSIYWLSDKCTNQSQIWSLHHTVLDSGLSQFHQRWTLWSRWAILASVCGSWNRLKSWLSLFLAHSCSPCRVKWRMQLRHKELAVLFSFGSSVGLLRLFYNYNGQKPLYS